MGTQDVRIWKDFPGRLTAVEWAAIRPQVSGRITEILFEDGQHVEQGDVLFVIDPRPYEAALSQARAALQAAQSNHKLADTEYKRAQELIKTNAISQRIVDERRSRFNFVLAEINGAKATLEQAEIDLDYAHVKAPISGRVSRAEITLGNVIESGPNAPVVTTIVADKEIYVDFEVDEQTYLTNIREQARSQEDEAKIPVQVILRGDKDHAIDGFIHAFDNRINPASGTIRARAVLQNDDGILLSGMFAKVRLGSAEAARHLLVGQKAIGTDQDRRFVYVVNNDNVIEYRQVELGDRAGQSRVVLSGLQEGEKVVSQGIMMIRPGMKVKPMEGNSMGMDVEKESP
ncbi:MAG: efflux RND transporter periplasmic adaptor subunit [Rhodospirillales bacterium]|nr:efflux RND transporter periplasmic adaptor subunit [Rhodospirillales bacterium]